MAVCILVLENILMIIWSILLFGRWQSSDSGFKVTGPRLNPHMMMVEGGSGSALRVCWLVEIFHFAICFLYHKDVRAFNEYHSNLKYSRTAMPLVHVLKNSNGYRISPSPAKKAGFMEKCSSCKPGFAGFVAICKWGLMGWKCWPEGSGKSDSASGDFVWIINVSLGKVFFFLIVIIKPLKHNHVNSACQIVPTSAAQMTQISFR